MQWSRIVPHFPFFLTNLNGREMLNSREVTELEYRTSKNIIYVDTFYVVPIQNEKGISSYEIFFKNFFPFQVVFRGRRLLIPIGNSPVSECLIAEELLSQT